jgi:Big-like domain-containing protein/uncharacterized protein DUF11
MLSHYTRPSSRVLLVAAVTAALVVAALPMQAATPSLRVREGRGIIAVDDEYTVFAGSQLEIVAPGVAANDRTSGAGYLTVGLVSAPSHGALTLATGGDFVYVPAKGFIGTDTFRYGITDGITKAEADVVLYVLGQVDVALTATAVPTHVKPGEPAIVTFRLINEGPSDAEAVKLNVSLPARSSGTQVRPDARCSNATGGRWDCPMGSLVPGGSITASFTITMVAPGAIEASGMAVAPNDTNPFNDKASIVVDAGQLALDPAHVTARLPWSPPARPADPLTVEAGISNATVAPLTYQIQAFDQSGNRPAWLTVEPAAGTADPMSLGMAKLVFSSVGVSPGLQRARLHFVHDSAFTFDDAPVSFTVAFRDVPAVRGDDPYIHALAGAGVTAGCKAGTFCPDQPLARAGAAVWLLLSGEGSTYQPPPAQAMFADVPTTRADAPYVEELVRRGVLEACAQDPAFLFCPDLPLARADAAVVVLRMLEGPDYTPPLVQLTFRDLVRDARAMFVEDAVGRGLFTSCVADRSLFCPDQGLTRGDAAVALVKAFNLPLF